MRSLISFAALTLLLAPPLVSQTTYTVDPYATPGTTTLNTITAAASVAIAGDTILIRPHTDWNTFPIQIPTGYSETHFGGTEVFPIDIAAGVSVKHSGDTGAVSVWSSVSSPPSSIFRLNGVASGTAPLTTIEDLYIIGGQRGIEIVDANPITAAEYSEFLGLIARCHFGWNQTAIDLEDKTSMAANLAVRECRIRTNFSSQPFGATPPPVFQSPSVGLRFHAVGKATASIPAQVNVEIRNLQTLGNFETMSPSGVPLPGGWHDFPSGYDEFTRLIEVFADPSGIHLEHNTGFPYNPIPEVNIDLIGGNLEGKADLNDTDAGWDVGLYATTGGYTGGSLWDFSAGYRIETSGTTFDGFRLAGIHGTCNRWGRGEVTLNGNTIVRDTGRQEAVAPTADILHGVHISSHYSYVALHATDASINNNKGNGISLKAKSSYDHENLVIPSGAFLDLDHCNIAQNGGHGIAMKVEEDGIVGGAWHILSGAISLINQATYNYSVEYGQGVVDGCSISNNGKAGLYFYPNRVSDGKSDIVNVRFTNCIVWNNPFGGYLADFSGSNLSPVFLAPLGHCTLAGNGNDSTYQSSLNIIEKDRSSGISGSYFWTEPAGSLSTKFYNTILERKSSSANDFAPGMLTGVYKFVMDDSLPISDDKIGAAGLRYQDGSSGPTFDKSTRLATPFVDSSSWTTLDPTKFYLSNHGTGNEFGETPTSFPLIGNETAFDHEGGSRPSASSGARDKGADEIL